MKGKVVLVTGATSGIGEVTLRGLAEKGATVIGVGRNPTRCAEVAASIQQSTGNQNVEFLLADLSVQADIRRLAEVVRMKYKRLDVLVNNAGGYFFRRQLSRDGIEMTFALNHMSYFLLTNLLIDMLKASAPARVVNVSSGAHSGGKINFADLGYELGYGVGWAAYAQSKLANILFTYEQARRLAGSGVTANALHPGFVATRFGHDNGFVVRWAILLSQKLGALTPEHGARTSIYLASSPDVEGLTGKYLVAEKPVNSSPASFNEAVAARLWEVSAAMTQR